jgi:hypothetical protein
VSAGPPQPLPEDRPGFEFDGIFPAARRRRAIAPPPPDWTTANVEQRSPSRAQSAQSAPARQAPAGRRAPATADSGDGTPARSEWAKLIRSLLPQPEKRNLAKEFRANLHFRGWALRVGVPILTMVAVGIAAAVVVGLHGKPGPAPSTATLGFPPATLAGHDFTAAPSTRGINQSLGRVASDGGMVVAVGSQNGARIPRAQFFFSHNGGGTWTLGTESAAQGGPPPPGHAANLVAGGHGNWVAIGPAAIWVSGNGEAWTLVSMSGLPDQVNVLRQTGQGFIAIGSDVVFVSSNGTSWQKVPGPPGALDLKFVATTGAAVLVAGDEQADRTVAGHPAVATVGAAWISRDGGRSWTPVTVPLGHGAQDQIAGVATAGTGFVVARPATVHGLPAADVYRSPDGAAWTFSTALNATGGFTTGLMNGGPAGAVITGQEGVASRMTPVSLTAFVSADGARWQRTTTFGSAASEAVSGVAVTADGAVISAAPSGAATGMTSPAFKVVKAGTGSVNVSLAAIPGATQPQVAVNAVAAEGSAQVAVGSANGYPAAWMSTDGGSMWTRATGSTASVLDRPGEQELTGVTDGPAGWLAVGGVVSGAPERPVVIISPDGSTWSAADAEPAFAEGGLFTEQVAASTKGYVIVGYQRTARGQTIAAAWWSAGLTGWQRAADGTPGSLDGAGDRQMLAVTPTSAGFTAVGLYGPNPAAWMSTDGKQWRGVTLSMPAGAARAVLLHVASAGRTVVATGMALTSSGILVPFAARSADNGATWTEVLLPVPSGTAQVTALAAAGGMFTATGSFGTSPGHQDVVVWTSADGLTWKATTPAGQGLAGPGIQAITGLTVSGSTLTGVGFTASTSGEQPLFWQSPIR